MERTPDAIALDFLDQTMSYRVLNDWSNRLANCLIRRGVGPSSVVGIMAERSLELVIAVLGVLKAGAAYLPIDPEYPPERQRYIIQDSGLTVVLTQSRYAAMLGDASVVVLDTSEAAFRTEPGTPPPCRAGPDNACYVIYTSGSTWSPKGIVTEHRAINNNLLWMQDCWPLSPTDSLLLKASFSFDVSVKEIFWPLMTGARLVIARPGGHREPRYLHEVIQQKGITIVHLVPTMLDYFLEHEAPGIERLRYVMCGGEALSIKLKERFCARYSAKMIHLYGPTEAAIAVTGATFWAGDRRASVTLGRPMANVTIRLLDRDLNQVPIGVPGELCIGGVALARGYLGRPDLTAEKFIRDPFSTGDGRLYRTGDLARWLPDGEIKYLGRMDRQVKVRGFRIEPGEVESAIKRHEPVRDAIVAERAGRTSASMLIAYVVPADRTELDLASIRRSCASLLPGFMVPDRFIRVDAIPMNPNGKADQEALSRLAADADPAADGNALRAGHENVEEIVRDIVRYAMSAPTLGLEDGLWERGLDSLALKVILLEIEEAFGIEVGDADLTMGLFASAATLAAYVRMRTTDAHA